VGVSQHTAFLNIIFHRDQFVHGNVVAALIANVSCALIAVRSRALTIRGSVVMGCMGFWIYYTLGWRGYLVPIIFFILGSLFTRVGYERKRKRRIAEKAGGTRGVREVLANGIVPLAFTVPILTVDARLFTIGFVGAWATALCDTAATELGGMWGRRCILVRNLRAVPPGTPGAVSIEGPASGFGAALLLVLAASGLGLAPVSLVIPIAAGALVASLLESLLAGLVPRGYAFKHEALNIFNTAVGGVLAVVIGMWLFDVG
jgi:uncharacterized protein (TIGR00297 family)